ncbi:MAG: ferredoxin [Candidatus Hodarchaeota archaeon]
MISVKIDMDSCIACGVCYALCGDVYETDDEGKSRIVGRFLKEQTEDFSIGEIDDGLKDCAQEGADSCPVDAIEIS